MCENCDPGTHMRSIRFSLKKRVWQSSVWLPCSWAKCAHSRVYKLVGSGHIGHVGRDAHAHDRNCPSETSKTATVTNTNKSSRASLQLTHELGGYIRRMRSGSPTEDLKNTSNTKIHQLSLSATPRLPLRLGGYWRGPRFGAPFDGKIFQLEDKKTTIH
jgi:hypothetical protein